MFGYFDFLFYLCKIKRKWREKTPVRKLNIEIRHK